MFTIYPAGPVRHSFRRGPWELYFGHFPPSLRGDEIGIVRLEARPSSENVVRKQSDVGIVVLQCVVVAAPLHRDAVFGARQFILQMQEVFVRVELRIILGDGQQAAERAVELAVSGDALGRSLRAEQR